MRRYQKAVLNNFLNQKTDKALANNKNELQTQFTQYNTTQILKLEEHKPYKNYVEIMWSGSESNPCSISGTPSAGSAAMLLDMNEKFTMGKTKSSLLS